MENQNVLIDTGLGRETHDYLALILNNTEEVFLLTDLDLIIVAANSTAYKETREVLGKELVIGTNVLNLVDEKEKRTHKKVFLKAIRGYASRVESVVYSLPDGEMYVQTLIKPAFDSANNIVGVVVNCKNITRKKKAQLQIAEAEERWQFALQATNQGAWDWNMQTDEVVYSDSYKKMYGFTDEELKNHLSEWQSRIHPEDRSRIEENIKEHSTSSDPYYETTYRIQLKNGEYKWIMARGKVLGKDADGNPLRMIGTHTDLTDTIRAKEVLKTMNERFVFAAKATSQALWEWDALTGEAYISPSFTELFGWEADSKQHFEQWHQYVHQDDKEETIDGYYRLLSDPTATIWQASYRFLKSNGEYAIVSDRAFIIRDNEGKVLRVIGATQDVTLQKKTEQELYKSNERFDIMLKATNELLWEWDIPSNHVYRAAGGLKKVYGLDDDSDIKSIENWMKRIHPDDHKNLQDILNELLNAANQQTFEIEYRFRKDNGTYAYIYDRGILLKDEKNQPLRMIGAAQDISERKRLEGELLRSELEHKKLINQATVDSQEQERGEIGKELHDNINQVLTTTKLYLELALANPDMVGELIKKSSKNISKVINEIRELSRSLMDPSLGDLGMVDSINDLIENINLARKIHISLDVDTAVENLLDKKQKLTIFRIIQEALNNVVKHADAKFVVVAIRYKNELVEVEIKDDGAGFQQESIKKGAGLKNITNRVYLINGSLDIKSNPGKGSKIKITFPTNHIQKQ